MIDEIYRSVIDDAPAYKFRMNYRWFAVAKVELKDENPPIVVYEFYKCNSSGNQEHLDNVGFEGSELECLYKYLDKEYHEAIDRGDFYVLKGDEE